MKLVYVAGPYRDKTGWGVECNIQRARMFGAGVANNGAMPVVPHANTAHYDGVAPDSFWLAGTLELLRRCDAVIMTADWMRSTGAQAERMEALAIGIPVFYSLEELRLWLTDPAKSDAATQDADESPSIVHERVRRVLGSL